jgi:hypothetical protein
MNRKTREPRNSWTVVAIANDRAATLAHSDVKLEATPTLKKATV